MRKGDKDQVGIGRSIGFQYVLELVSQARPTSILKGTKINIQWTGDQEK